VLAPRRFRVPDPGTSVSIRDETIMAAIAGFLDQWVFGHDRAAMLTDLIPATTAEQAAARERQQAHLNAELARVGTAQAGLLTELELLGSDTSPATQAYRQRIQARHAELHDDHARTQAQLDDLAAATTPDQDPALLDELPYLTSQLDDAPAELVEALIDALDIQILYRPEQHQATIWATLTDTTPATITAPAWRPPRNRQPDRPPAARPDRHTSPRCRVGTRPYLTRTGHDHENRSARPATAGAEVQVVQERARPLVLVPFWKPPKNTERIMRITIRSRIHSRQPPARDRGQRRRRRAPYRSGRLNKDLYIPVCMPRHSTICRARRII